MGYDPPGLEHRPDDTKLAGFGSLMPPPSDKPGIVKRIITLPVKIVTLPIKIVVGILKLPARLFGRSKD